eukprot:NODE_188_length_15619_cov_0.374871.p2 type:complete len:590 gc:universal NODE_188_length_15619_cov_0.374871:7367-5598(-)
MPSGFQNKLYIEDESYTKIECDEIEENLVDIEEMFIMYTNWKGRVDLKRLTKITIIGCRLKSLEFLKDSAVICMDLSDNDINTKELEYIPASVKCLNIAKNNISSIRIFKQKFDYLNVSDNCIWDLYEYMDIRVTHLVLFDPTFDLKFQETERHDIRQFLLKCNLSINKVDLNVSEGPSSHDFEIEKCLLQGYLSNKIDVFKIMFKIYFIDGLEIGVHGNEIRVEHKLWCLYNLGQGGISQFHSKICKSVEFRIPFDLISSVPHGYTSGVYHLELLNLVDSEESVTLVKSIIFPTDTPLLSVSDTSRNLNYALGIKNLYKVQNKTETVVYLNISNQNLSTFPSNIGTISYLIASHNNFKSIPLYKSLILLDISYNTISSYSEVLGLSHLKTLKYLDIRKNPLNLCSLFGKTILHHLIHYNGKYLHEYKDIDYSILSIESCHLLLHESFENIVSLQLPFNEIRLVNFQFVKQFPNLKTADFSNNRLSSVEFLNGSSIETLILTGNVLEEFNVKLNTLRVLDLSFNRIRNMLFIESQIALKQLDLGRNRICKLQFKTLFPELTVLRLSKNIICQIAKIWDDVPKLTHLYLE